MSKKELWQVGWAGGQTEGDVSPQTVKEILNAEIDIKGTLYPRDEFVYDVAEDEAMINVIDLKFMVNPADPDETLNIFLTTTHLRIRSATVTEDIAFGITMDTDSEMLVVEGSDIYIAAIVSGEPVGIYTISYLKADTRFAPPSLVAPILQGGLQAFTSNWIMDPPGTSAPIMTHIPITATYEDDVIAETVNDSASKVVIGTYMHEDFKTGSWASLPINTSYSAEYAVQFTYQNEQTSELSNTILVSYQADDTAPTHAIGIAVNLAVSRELSDNVKEINVYRKVHEIDGTKNPALTTPYELLFVIPIMTDDIEDQNIVAPTGFILPEYTEVDPAVNKGATVLGQGALELHTDITRTVDSGDDIMEVVGWLRYQTDDAMFFWPRSIVYSGTLNLNLVAESDDQIYYKAVFAQSLGVFTAGAGISSFVVHFTGADVDGDFTYTPFTQASPSGNNINPLMHHSTTLEYTGYGPDVAPYMIDMNANGVYTAKTIGLTDTGAIGVVSSRHVVLSYLDIGEAGLATFDDISGFTIQEKSEVLPRHIGKSAGRLLYLNVVQDGKSKPSRLCYSEFRKYQNIAKSSYVDYDARDDGHGVGIAEFKGRLLVLHSTSTYIMDISAGGGMTWRELGAYNEINALGRPAVVETPFGVFFGGQDYAYLFDGNRVTNITETPDRRVSTQYRQMVARGDVTFAWRATRRQLWIMSLDADSTQEALVYDADVGSWHHHMMDEMGVDDTTPEKMLSFWSSGVNEYFYSWYDSATVRRYNLDDTTIVRPFSWGIYTGKVNMGSSEFQKKLKRIYVDTVGKIDDDGNETYGRFVLDVAGYSQDFSPGVDRIVTRISSSNKDYYLDFSLIAPEDGGGSWTGTMESLGLSYKPKKLK